MIPLLLFILYKKKGKSISRATKKMLGKAKARRMLKKIEADSKKRGIKNVYRRFKNNRFNSRRVGNR